VWQPECRIDQSDRQRNFQHWPNSRRERLPNEIPTTASATALASSKIVLAAVTEDGQVGAPDREALIERLNPVRK